MICYIELGTEVACCVCNLLQRTLIEGVSKHSAEELGTEMARCVCNLLQKTLIEGVLEHNAENKTSIWAKEE
jgi:hypothetical protein